MARQYDRHVFKYYYQHNSPVTLHQTCRRPRQIVYLFEHFSQYSLLLIIWRRCLLYIVRATVSVQFSIICQRMASTSMTPLCDIEPTPQPKAKKLCIVPNCFVVADEPRSPPPTRIDHIAVFSCAMSHSCHHSQYIIYCAAQRNRKTRAPEGQQNRSRTEAEQKQNQKKIR